MASSEAIGLIETKGIVAAVEALDTSLRATRARARILRRHWIPRLRNRLHDLEFALEQAEQEDHARLRRVVT